MTTRREFIRNAAQAGTLGLASAAGLSLAGCGGSMGSSAIGMQLTGVTAYGGNPTVTIKPAQGAATTGDFTIDKATGVLQTNTEIFVIVTVDAEVPAVNGQYFTGTPPQTIGTFSMAWSQVLPSPTAPQTVIFNSTAGTTFTGAAPAATPNVRLSGEGGNGIRVTVPGTITLRIDVTLQLSDGSGRTKSFDVNLTIVP